MTNTDTGHMVENTTETGLDDIAIIIKNKELFKDWFVKTYFREFNEMPTIITKVDIDELLGAEKHKEKERIKTYMTEIMNVVSTSMFQRDLTEQVLGHGRQHDAVLVRKISLHILCTMLKFPKPLAAELMNKDRTTVLHHCKTMNGFLKVDKSLKMKLEQILVKLEQRNLVILKYKNEEGKIFRKK